MSAKHAGTGAAPPARQRSAYALGGSPVTCRNARLNELGVSNPTSSAAAVSDWSVPRSSSCARSILRRFR